MPYVVIINTPSTLSKSNATNRVYLVTPILCRKSWESLCDPTLYYWKMPLPRDDYTDQSDRNLRGTTELCTYATPLRYTIKKTGCFRFLPLCLFLQAIHIVLIKPIACTAEAQGLALSDLKDVDANEIWSGETREECSHCCRARESAIGSSVLIGER